MKLRTWHLELLVAAAVVIGTTAATATRLVDWLACAAVIASFCHGQVAERMAEAQGELARPTVDCYRVANFYWIFKECLWLSYFIADGVYAAVCGCVLFASYPAWRRFWRARRAREALP